MSKRTKANFCMSFDWALPIMWLDLTGFHEYGGGRIAKVELSEAGVSGTYAGFHVTVLNTKSGTIDRKLFRFDDYLPRAEDFEGGFRVISHVGWKWYVNVPPTTSPLCRAVEAYISLFKRVPTAGCAEATA